jgi:hypothetical protein
MLVFSVEIRCINYTKPDIICGTESWLKGIQVFPKKFKIYRNARGPLGEEYS